MGADLYIPSISDPARKKYEPEFNAAVAKRNAARTPKAEAAAQQEVEAAWEKMFPPEGYFRDSYNDSNLLNRLDLDYWTWFGQYVKDDGMMYHDEIRAVLAEVQSRRPKLDQIADPDDRTYFMDKYNRFVAFLNQALANPDDAIRCSI